jgi:SAM-dependent methyltransferase
MNPVSVIRRLFYYQAPDQTEFWRNRAQESGTKSVLWSNEVYNECAQRDQWAAIARNLPAQRGHVLDLGCGTGRLSEPLGELFERYTGVDLDTMVAEARRRHPEFKGEYVAAKAQEYNFPPDTFDLVLSMACLSSACRADEMPDMARRIAVSLKPGGRVVMIDPFHTLPLLLRNCRLTAREVFGLFEQQGLRLREWSGVHFIPGRLLFTRPGMDKRASLTRKGYRLGEFVNRIAPRRFADYIVIALEKPQP